MNNLGDPMYYFLGNCQVDFVSKVMEQRGHACTYRVLASPLTYTSHPDSIPPSLAAVADEYGLGDFFHGRQLSHQFTPVAQEDPAPELIVLSLFHENTPLFVHDEEQYVFYMDSNGLTEKPGMMEWAQKNCRMFNPNPATYLDRYKAMVAQLRMSHPSVPIVILARLGHYPAFGPDPFSYLEHWGALWTKAEETLNGWTSEFSDLHILDMNRVFGGIWNSSDTSIESLCPFLKIKLEEKDRQIVGLHAQRDIEHIGPMPERLADKLADFLETGKISYDETETIPFEWRKQWRPAKLDKTVLLAKLMSGANYQGAEAVAGFFLDLGTDYTDLLVQAKERMAVCHNTLHMIKNYGRIHRNPAQALWCDAHLDAAAQFTTNGPLFQESYITRLKEMRTYALGE